jgi:hypothetical protein
MYEIKTIDFAEFPTKKFSNKEDRGSQFKREEPTKK